MTNVINVAVFVCIVTAKNQLIYLLTFCDAKKLRCGGGVSRRSKNCRRIRLYSNTRRSPLCIQCTLLLCCEWL